MSDFSSRRATSADLGAITAIYAEAVLNGTATFEIDPPSQAEMGAPHDGADLTFLRPPAG